MPSVSIWKYSREPVFNIYMLEVAREIEGLCVCMLLEAAPALAPIARFLAHVETHQMLSIF